VHRIPNALLAPSLLCALLASASDAELRLAKSGGALPGTTTFALTGGGAGELYLLVPALSEAATVAPTGVALQVPLSLLPYTLAWPGFLGFLSGAGGASIALPLPDLASLVGVTISVQGVAGTPLLTEASNLVRVTPQAPGTFAATLGSPPLPIAGGAIAAQADGKLQIVGGSGPAAQIYDADREEFELGGLAFGVGLLSQSTALADGRILFTGGLGPAGQPTNAAAVYDPATGTTVELAMAAPRAGHGATLLGDGRVLVSGGFGALDLTDLLALFAGIQSSTELFHPATMSFAAGPAMLEARALHTSTPLASGGALVAGGLTLIPIVGLPIVSSTAYEFTPALGLFGLPKVFSGGRLAHSGALLSDGKVLLCGGVSIDFGAFFTTLDPLSLSIGTLDDCVLYTPGLFGSFATKPGLSAGRAFPTIHPLPGGEALIAGGADLLLDLSDLLATQLLLLADADRYAAGALAPTGAMQAPRLTPLMHTLDDGTVLVVGGGPLEAEVYQP
jgi:hypothetical protein